MTIQLFFALVAFDGQGPLPEIIRSAHRTPSVASTSARVDNWEVATMATEHEEQAAS